MLELPGTQVHYTSLNASIDDAHKVTVKWTTNSSASELIIPNAPTLGDDIATLATDPYADDIYRDTYHVLARQDGIEVRRPSADHASFLIPFRYITQVVAQLVA
ncbi:MAG: hypothetical protein CL814_10890 [Confluentimicrobium sp.]|uniref:hypothetical protein n=1 Tax=Actibacterium sp. TaxID=1872125 RepID=UPI000C4E958F|nr:hypothetical protein [Actibacterium sp.]MBC57428.1 hypothetical protein [Actibacterium sp.]|tara:strand:- start:10068 stop:10379 length:312 start_codon:yes stop_codon:yes gene_type:complete